MPELRRLLHNSIDSAKQRQKRLRWSDWRRTHQATAQRCHRQRRARANPASPPAAPRTIVLAETAALTDERWPSVSALLPQKAARGRPATDHRLIVEGILWVARTGLAWRSLPERYGPWETVHSRYRRWRLSGLWERIAASLHSPPGHAAP